MELKGVPEEIEWEQVKRFLEAELHLPIDDLHQDGIHIGWNNIECKVFAVNPEGRRYVDNATGNVAMHVVQIPITHEKPE